MDFLLATIASILFPYILNLSGIDYKANVGVRASLQDSNKYHIEFLDKNSDYYIKQSVLINYTGYGVRPEFFLDYDINFGRFIVAPAFGYEPLNTGIQYRYSLKTGGSQSTNAIYYNKGPSLGIKLGFSVLKPYPELSGYGAFGFTPYIEVGVVPVSYEAEAYYQGAQEKMYNYYLGAGAKIDVKGPWSIYGQYKYLTFNTNGSSLNNQLVIKESEFQFGLAYWLRTQEKKAKLDKDTNYNNIMQTLSSPYGENGKADILVSPEGYTIKDGDTNNNHNLEQVKVITDTSKELKKDSTLLDKVKNKKVNNSNTLNPYEFKE